MTNSSTEKMPDSGDEVEVTSTLIESHKEPAAACTAATIPPSLLPRTTTFPTELKAGNTVDRFVLDRRLGEGGFGEVWACHDPRLNRFVAIKFASTKKHPGYKSEELLKEARKVSCLSHPSIVPIFDVLQDGTEFAIVSELIDGPTLKGRMDHGLIPIREVVAIVRDVAAGLQHAHQHDLVHRDVKPSNILLRKSGPATITDFGLAASEVQLEHMNNGTSGTLFFMSPEQASGDILRLDNRTDIFCLGIVLFHCLTAGRFPYPETQDKTRYRENVARRQPRALRAVDSSLPRALDVICSRCLATESSRRYQSAQDLIDDLNSFLTQDADQPTGPAARPLSKAPVAIVSGAIALLGIILLIVFLAAQPTVYAPTREQSTSQPAGEQLLNQINLIHPPEIFAWELSDSRGKPEHTAETQTYKVRSPTSRFVATCGSTDLRELNLEVEFALADWIGTAGIFWGLRQSELDSGRTEYRAFIAEFSQTTPEFPASVTVSELTFTPIDAREMNISTREIQQIEVERPAGDSSRLVLQIRPGSLLVEFNGRKLPPIEDRISRGSSWLPARTSEVGVTGMGTEVVLKSLNRF